MCVCVYIYIPVYGMVKDYMWGCMGIWLNAEDHLPNWSQGSINESKIETNTQTGASKKHLKINSDPLLTFSKVGWRRAERW